MKLTLKPIMVLNTISFTTIFLKTISSFASFFINLDFLGGSFLCSWRSFFPVRWCISFTNILNISDARRKMAESIMKVWFLLFLTSLINFSQKVKIWLKFTILKISREKDQFLQVHPVLQAPQVLQAHRTPPPTQKETQANLEFKKTPPL